MTSGVSDPAFPFDNSYQRLPDRFFARIKPTPVSQPQLIKVNVGLAELLGLDATALASEAGVQMLAGNRLPAGSEPIAMAYAGHQFGGFSPQLGDGRAILLGEIVGRDGVRRDVQLKGSGPTPFSRRGDGRAALGPVLREYIVSEAMAALGIPTTRSLAAVTTGDYVFREGPIPGGVLTRVAASHIRVGTFEYFAAREDVEALRLLADHVISRLYPDLEQVDNRYLALLEQVVQRQAQLVASWLHIGFIHGVMNTDNMSVAGETIDYGPCAFMDAFDPKAVFSSIDQGGRYAYGNQPAIAQWNLARLAETLLPLIDADQQAAIAGATKVLDRFPEEFAAHYLSGMSRKIGLMQPHEGDGALVTQLLGLMRAAGADFTLTFRHLAEAVSEAVEPIVLQQLIGNEEGLAAWLQAWRARLALEAVSVEELQRRLRSVNPIYIPRNHLVEEVIAAAVSHGDLQPFEALLDAVLQPFDERPGRERYAAAPTPEQIVHETFCGT
ncbi:MAG: YdiU family protein [Hyphomicrobiaceae bacterium]|nr:YdiU family protein [Hyphomicrobiaceae bacterium]